MTKPTLYSDSTLHPFEWLSPEARAGESFTLFCTILISGSKVVDNGNTAVVCVVVAVLAKDIRRLDVSCIALISTVHHLPVDVHPALLLLLWMLLLPSTATICHCCC